METTDSALIVQFVSDGTGTGQGFSLFVEDVPIACGDTINLRPGRTSQTFTSLNYPQNYVHNLDCVWIIIAPANELVQLDFLDDFNIERHSR